MADFNEDDLKYLSWTLPEETAQRLSRGGIDVEEQFGAGRSYSDEDRTIGWGDFGRGLAAGAVDIAAGQAANVEYLTRGQLGTESRQALDKLSEEQLQQASMQFRRAAQSAFFPTDGQESIFDVGLTDALIAKGAMMLPSLVAAIIPAGAVSAAMRGFSVGTRSAAAAATAKTAASSMNMGDMAKQIYSEVDKLSDEQLARKSSTFNGYLLMGMDPQEARRLFRQDVAGAAPLAAAAITYATGGLEGMVGKRLGGDQALGFLRGFGKGALAEGTQEVAENAGNEIMGQQMLSRYNLGEEDWTKVLNAAVEGFALGGLIGGPIGGLTNIGGPKKPKATTGDETVDAALDPDTTPEVKEPNLRDELNTFSADVEAGKQEVAKLKRDLDPAQEAALRGSFTEEDEQEADAFQFNQDPPSWRSVVDDTPFFDDTGQNLPETDDDIEAQRWQLAKGERAAMLYPKGTPERGLPPGMGTVETEAGIFHFNPALIDAQTIRTASAMGRENMVLGLGPFNKADIFARTQRGEKPVAVTETTPTGATVRSAVGTEQTAPVQQAEIQKVASPENTVQVEPVEAPVVRRVTGEPAPAPVVAPAPKAAAAKAVSKTKTKQEPVADLLATKQKEIEGVPSEAQDAAGKFLAARTPAEEAKAVSSIRMALSLYPVDETNAIVEKLKQQKGQAPKRKRVDREAAKQAMKDAQEAMARGDDAAAAEARQRISANLPVKEAKAVIDALMAGQEAPKTEVVDPAEALREKLREAVDAYVSARASGNVDEMADQVDVIWELAPNMAEEIVARANEGTEIGSNIGDAEQARTRQKSEPQLAAPQLTEEQRQAELAEAKKAQDKDKKSGFATSAKAVSTTDSNFDELVGTQREGTPKSAAGDLRTAGGESGRAKKVAVTPEVSEKILATDKDALRRQKAREEANKQRQADIEEKKAKRGSTAKSAEEKATDALLREKEKLAREAKAKGLKIGEKTIEQMAKRNLADRAKKKETQAKGTGQLDIARVFGKAAQERIDEALNSELLSGDPEPEAANALERDLTGRSFGEVIEYLVKYGKGQNYKTIASRVNDAYKKLAAAGVEFNFRIINIGDQVPSKVLGLLNRAAGVAHYNPTATGLEQNVYINGSSRTGIVGLTHETVLHELVHAVTQAALYIGEDLNTMKGATVIAPEIKQLHSELKAVQQAFVLHFNKRIADFKAGKTELTELERAIYNGANTGRTVSELVAWGLTNQPFQDYLRGIQYGPKPEQNLLQRMFQAIAEYFGFKEQEGTAFYAFLKATDQVFNLDAKQIIAQGAALGLKMPQSVAAARVNAAQIGPENVTQRVSENIMSSVSATATQVAQTASNWGDRANKFITRFMMTNDQLRQAAERVGPEFGEVFFKVTDALERMGVRGRKYMQRGHEIAEQLYKLRRAKPELFQKFADLANDATVNDIHPDQELDAPIHSYMFKSNGSLRRKYIQAAARHAELRKAYLDIIAEDKNFEAAYQEAKAYFAEMQDAITRANIDGVLVAAGDTIKLPEGKTRQDLGKWLFDGGLEIPVQGDDANAFTAAELTQAQEYREALGEKLVNHLTGIASMKRLKGAYFPLMRRGDFVIQGYEKFDTMGGEYDRDRGEVYFDSLKDAKRFARTTDVKVSDIQEVAFGPDGKRTYVDPEGNTQTYKLQDVDTKGRFAVKIQNRYVEFFETAAEAEAAHAKASASGDFEGLSGVQNRRDQNVNLSLADRQVQILINSIQQRKGLDEAQRKVLQDAILQSAITLMPGSRVQHRRKPRRYVAGASNDLVQNTLDYSTSVGNYRAKQELGIEISDGMKQVRELHDQMKYAAGDRTLSRDNLVAELETRIGANAVMQDTGTMSKAVRVLLSLSFLDKLASPAYSLINSMQPWMVTHPILAAKYGWPNATRELMQAYRDIGGLDTVRAGLSDTIRMWNQDKGTDFLSSFKDRLRERYPGSKGRQLAELLEYLAERGAIDPEAGLEIARLNATTNRAGLALNRAELIARAMPTAIEAMNRATTAIAEYNLAVAKGLSHEAAMKSALTQVNNTQGNYSVTNAAPIFNHPLARIALQFKKYGQMMYHLLGQNVYHAFKGASPEEKAQARKALFNIAVAHTALAGVLGLPLEPIKLLLLPIGLLGGPDYDDLEDALRQAVAKYFGNKTSEVVAKGLPRLFGFDLSSRVGLDSMLTFGGPRDQTEQGVKTWLFDTMAGAPVGLVVDWAKVPGLFMNGEIIKGMEKLVPLKVVSDSLRAYREGTEGKVTKSGRQSMEPTNAAEMGLRAFGITPGSVARKGERDRVFYRNQKEGVTARQEMMGAWLNAPKAERGRQWDKIRKWNEGKSEGQRITLEDLKNADKRRATEMKSGQIKDGYRVNKRDEDAYNRAAIYK